VSFFLSVHLHFIVPEVGAYAVHTQIKTTTLIQTQKDHDIQVGINRPNTLYIII